MDLIDNQKTLSEIVKIDIGTKDFDINYIYTIFGDQIFDKKLVIGDETKSIKGSPYLELLILTNTDVVNVYNNFGIKNELNTMVGGDLDINDPKIIINDKRVWVMDRQIVLIPDPPINTPSYITVPFKKNKCLTTKLKWVATVTKVSGAKPYNEITVNRKSIFVYYPLRTLFLLVNNTCNNSSKIECLTNVLFTNKTCNNLSQIKIYVMQSINNQIDPNINLLNAQYLSTKLTLPPGWIFSTINLDTDTYLKVVSTNKAYVLGDSLGNTYQYLDPKYCPWIYKLYSVPL